MHELSNVYPKKHRGRVILGFFSQFTLALFVSSFWVGGVSAQSNRNSLPVSLPVHSMGLAAADLFPTSFLPFHFDKRIQIVAIPSRAVGIESGFAALEYNGNPVSTDLIDSDRQFARPQLAYTLLSAERSKLFSFYIGGSRNSFGREPELTDGNYTSNLSYLVDTGVRFVTIRELSPERGFHFGIHANYRDALARGEQNILNGSETANDQIRRTDTTATNGFDRGSMRELSSGLEFGWSSDNLDILLDASYHLSTDQTSSQQRTLSTTETDFLFTTPGFPDFSRRERGVSNLTERNGMLHSIAASTYLRRETDRANRSVFFVSNVVIGFGDLDGQSRQDRIERQTDFVNDRVSAVQDNSVTVLAELNEPSNTWLFRIGSGVEMNGEFGALSASGGLAVDVLASNFKNVLDDRSTTSYVVASPHRELVLTLPAIAYVEVYRDIHLFGGLIVAASYSYDKQGNRTLFLDEDLNPVQNESATLGTLRGQYPLGIMAGHPSGFFMQAAFRGSLTSYNSWRLTIGLDLD